MLHWVACVPLLDPFFCSCASDEGTTAAQHPKANPPNVKATMLANEDKHHLTRSTQSKTQMQTTKKSGKTTRFCETWSGLMDCSSRSMTGVSASSRLIRRNRLKTLYGLELRHLFILLARYSSFACSPIFAYLDFFFFRVKSESANLRFLGVPLTSNPNLHHICSLCSRAPPARESSKS